MIIAATSSFTLGPFTVQVRPRFDSPAWAVYIVLRGRRLIGKQFSRPSLDDCRWLESHAREERVVYADSSFRRRAHPYYGQSLHPGYSIRGGQATKRRRETEPA